MGKRRYGQRGIERKKIYIAGKITGDPHYYDKFDAAEGVIDSIYRNAHIDTAIINPTWLPEGMSNADYMRISFACIDAADYVIFLPDWGKSDGAKLEFAYCKYIGKAIGMYEEFLSEYKKWRKE